MGFSEIYVKLLMSVVPFYVSPFFRSVMGSNKEPDLVHLEARTIDGRK